MALGAARRAAGRRREHARAARPERARRERRGGARGGHREAPRLALRAGAARRRAGSKLKNVGAPGARDRRLDRRARAAARGGVGALLLGVHERGRRAALRRAASAAASATRELDALGGAAARRSRARPRRSRRRAEAAAAARIFCEPELVAEVEFREWTADGLLRAAVLRGAARGQAGRRGRARGSRREQGAGKARRPSPLRVEQRGARARAPWSTARELTLSNLDKVLYPRRGYDQARGDRVLRADRAGAARRTSRAGR